jgi:hypothetical protein
MELKLEKYAMPSWLITRLMQHARRIAYSLVPQTQTQMTSSLYWRICQQRLQRQELVSIFALEVVGARVLDHLPKTVQAGVEMVVTRIRNISMHAARALK